MLADTLRRVSIMGATIESAQSKTATLPTGTASAPIALTTPVDPLKSFVIPNASFSDGGVSHTSATCDLAADGASVTVTRANGASYPLYLSFTVVELTGDAKVNKYTVAHSGTGLTYDYDLADPVDDISLTMLMQTLSLPGNGPARGWRVDGLLDANTVRFIRSESYNQAQTSILYVVEF